MTSTHVKLEPEKEYTLSLKGKHIKTLLNVIDNSMVRGSEVFNLSEIIVRIQKPLLAKVKEDFEVKGT